MKELQDMITRLIGLKDGEFEQIVFNAGLDYAEKYTYGNKDMLKRLIATKMYWEWWKNVWSSIDARFLGSYRFYNAIDKRSLRIFYIQEHDPDMLQLKPNNLVFKEIINAI